MSEIPPQTPYTAVYVLLRKDNKVAFIKRGNTGWMDGHFGLPAGKIDIDENALTAAVRETKEEAGVTVDTANLRHILTMHRKSDEADDPMPIWIDIYFEAAEFKGEPYNAEPHKHDSLEWFSLKDMPDNTIPAIRFGLEQIEAGNTYCEFGWDN